MAETERPILPEGAAETYDRLFSESALSVHRETTGESDQVARAGRQMLRRPRLGSFPVTSLEELAEHVREQIRESRQSEKVVEFDPHEEKLFHGGPSLAELDPNEDL